MRPGKCQECIQVSRVQTNESEIHEPGGSYRPPPRGGRQERWVEQRGSLPVGRAEMGRFVSALFKYADQGTYVSLRAFPDTEDGPFFAVIGVEIGDDLSALAT